ncbi:MAG: RNA-binding protein [uncultured bacterium]|nr:MAG: RNA-binding protein [uncultured bacterium]
MKRMPKQMEADQAFVDYVVKSIVDHPDDVNAERTIDERGVLISLKVNPEDMGQVIGRAGATAKSIRTLLRVIGAKNNARVNLKIIEPEGSTRGIKNEAPKSAKSAKTSSKSASDVVDDLNI